MGSNIYGGYGCCGSGLSISFGMGMAMVGGYYGMGYPYYSYSPYWGYYDPWYYPYYGGWGYGYPGYWGGSYWAGYYDGYWDGYYGGGYGGGYYPYPEPDPYGNYYGPRGSRSGSSDGTKSPVISPATIAPATDNTVAVVRTRVPVATASAGDVPVTSGTALPQDPVTGTRLVLYAVTIHTTFSAPSELQPMLAGTAD